MSFTKTKIYNLALSHLLLARQVDDTETDTITNEVRVLNTFWDEAFALTLQELDLDSLSEKIPLELLEVLSDDIWTYAYKYPTRCGFLRKLVSGALVDTNRTHIAKRTGMLNNQKVIFTDEQYAVAECITKDFPLALLGPSTGLAVSYMLAFLSAPLIVGKGAKKLKETIYADYEVAKMKSQNLDALENFNYDNSWDRSEFVAARME